MMLREERGELGVTCRRVRNSPVTNRELPRVFSTSTALSAGPTLSRPRTARGRAPTASTRASASRARGAALGKLAADAAACIVAVRIRTASSSGTASATAIVHAALIRLMTADWYCRGALETSCRTPSMR